MAGDGNYGGNGSVYWEVHHRENNAPVALVPKRNGRHVTHQDKVPQPPPRTEHYLELDNGLATTGYDPTPVSSIGGGTGNFEVTMCFSISPVAAGSAAPAAAPTGATLAALQQDRKLQIQTTLNDVIEQANQALTALDNNEVVKLVVSVPAVGRANKPAGTPADPWEVHIEW